MFYLWTLEIIKHTLKYYIDKCLINFIQTFIIFNVINYLFVRLKTQIIPCFEPNQNANRQFIIPFLNFGGIHFLS